MKKIRFTLHILLRLKIKNEIKINTCLTDCFTFCFTAYLTASNYNNLLNAEKNKMAFSDIALTDLFFDILTLTIKK